MIGSHFNEEELIDLCMGLEVDYESLGGDGKSAKIKRLVSYLERRGRSSELINRLDDLRDHVAWPQI